VGRVRVVRGYWEKEGPQGHTNKII
jgi:hypothetical protein